MDNKDGYIFQVLGAVVDVKSAGYIHSTKMRQQRQRVGFRG